MAGFIREIVIHQPIEEVFSGLTTPAHMPGWMSFVVACDLAGGEPMAEGARLDVDIAGTGRRRRRRHTVTIYQRPRVFALASRRLGVSFTYRLELTGIGRDITRVNLQASFEGAWWARPFVTRTAMAMEEADGDMLVRFRSHMKKALDA